MYRSGYFQSGEIFSQEAQVDLNDEFKYRFKELNSIIREIKDKKVELALLWAKGKQKELERSGSDLTFNLHYIKINRLL